MTTNENTQGELIQFRAELRCEACQAGDHKCVLQMSDEQCISCSASRNDCIFGRMGIVKGPKSLFSNPCLLSENTSSLPIFDMRLWEM